MRLVTEGGEFVAHPLERLGTARADRHRGAGLSAGERDRPPDAAASAANHRLLARKVDLHTVSPPR